MGPYGNRSPLRAPRPRSSAPSAYHDAPYGTDRHGYSDQLVTGGLFTYDDMQDHLCNNCKHPGHYARDCANVAVCNNSGFPWHIAAECTAKTLCWNCKESGLVASECSNKPVCHLCNKADHLCTTLDFATIVINLAILLLAAQMGRLETTARRPGIWPMIAPITQCATCATSQDMWCANAQKQS